MKETGKSEFYTRWANKLWWFFFFNHKVPSERPSAVEYESMMWERASALLILADATAAGSVRSSASEEVSAHFSLEHPLVPDLPGSLWSISLQFHYIDIPMFLTLNWYWPRLLNACLGDCPARLLTKPSPKISGSVLECIVLDVCRTSL